MKLKAAPWVAVALAFLARLLAPSIRRRREVEHAPY